MNENKKLSTIYVYKILREYSDENHPLTQTKIKELLETNYSLLLERKAISRALDDLANDSFLGADIIKCPGGGCFLGARSFEPSEVRFLIDAIFSSKSLNSKQANSLAKKIYNDLSMYDRKDFSYIYKTSEVNRANNNQLFYNIEMISEAIKQNKQIEFNYNRFYVDPLDKQKQTTKKYRVNPYYMVNNGGKYYLICNYFCFNEIANYRMEQISNIKILDIDIKPITKLCGCEKGFDIAKYVNDNIYMFNTKTISAVIKIEDEYIANYVVDWFGSNAKIYKKNNEIFANIEVNEQALIYWCLQYGENVELLEPKETRLQLKKIIGKMREKYDN